MTKRTQAELEQAVKEHRLKNNPVTRRQAKQQLAILGKLSLVQPAIDGVPDGVERELAQIYWDEAQEFERYHPVLIQLASAIGFTDSELDQMFEDARLL